MDVRTVGVEEELLVVDPATGSVTSGAGEVLQAVAQRHPTDDSVGRELFRHMVETRTEPARDLDEVLRQTAERRQVAGEAAAARGLALAAAGSAPTRFGTPEVTAEDRYEDIVGTYGQVARLGTTCGLHVHVWIASDEEGVRCLDRMAPWLPVLLAVSANSPYADGVDTGYASWRTQQWSSWPSAGPTERFGSVAGYRRTCARAIASGAARDEGMLYFDARLSTGQPTLEVRLLDVATDVEDTGLLVALVRGLVETLVVEAEGGLGEGDEEVWRAEELRWARWRAARHGLADQLMHPRTRDLRPAREVLHDLVDKVRSRLDAAGDTARVERGVERVLAGTGASRQRAAYERSGTVEGVVDDLVVRTADVRGTAPSSDQHERA